MKEIIFSGDSHIGLYALSSIQKTFDKVYILKDNPTEIINAKRECDELIDNFDDSDCPFVFLGGHLGFITKKQLETKTYINMHGSLLPKYRGRHSTFWAIMNDEKQLGITFHLVDEYMDSGAVLAQYSFEYYGQTVAEINETIDNLILKYSGEVLSKFINKEIVPVEQDNSLATYCCKRNLDDCYVDFNWSNEMLRRLFRALTEPYPLPMLKIHDKRYEITEYKITEALYFGAVGRVHNIDGSGVWIKTSEGFLIVNKVRKYGSKNEEYLKELVKNGHRFYL